MDTYNYDDVDSIELINRLVLLGLMNQSSFMNYPTYTVSDELCSSIVATAKFLKNKDESLNESATDKNLLEYCQDSITHHVLAAFEDSLERYDIDSTGMCHTDSGSFHVLGLSDCLFHIFASKCGIQLSRASYPKM